VWWWPEGLPPPFLIRHVTMAKKQAKGARRKAGHPKEQPQSHTGGQQPPLSGPATVADAALEYAYVAPSVLPLTCFGALLCIGLRVLLLCV